MGYIQNNTNEIVVDAVLTKTGLQKIALDQPLNITRFALYDDEVDYALFNIDNPNGSDYFDSAISNLPLLEARIHDNNGDSAQYGLFTKPPVPGAPTNTTFVLDVSIPADFNTGISNANIPYAFTPSITPVPDDDRYIYYQVTITAKSSMTGLALPLGSVELVGSVDFSSGKIETAELVGVRQKIASEKSSVGSPAVTGGSGGGSGGGTGAGGSGTSGNTGTLNIPKWVNTAISKLPGTWTVIALGTDSNGDDYADIVDKLGTKKRLIAPY